MPQKIAIIGSGFGGLSAAALLAKRGYQVEVFEKNDQPGGRAAVFHEKGYTFDMGPSWYLMPDIYERFFAHFGKSPQQLFNLKKLSPYYRFLFEDNTQEDITSNITQIHQLFAKYQKDGREKLNAYLKDSAYKYDISVDKFIYQDFDSITQLFNKEILLQGQRLKVFENMQTFVKRFFTSERLQQIIQYNVLFLGGSPTISPAVYSMLTHVDYTLGVWYPVGGMNAIATAMYDIAKSMGVKFHFNEEVVHIESSQGRASGIRTKKKLYDADIVVSNADYAHSELDLLNPREQSYGASYWQKKVLAPSGFIIFLGLDTKVKKLAHHTMVMNGDWSQHFKELFDQPAWPTNPSYYVGCPTKTDTTIAPQGCDSLFVLVPVAPGLDDSEDQRSLYKEKILTHLEHRLGQNIRDHIKVSRIFSQKDFATRYNAYKGTALGMAHTLFQSLSFRPHHQSKHLKNLFYCGQYTHPGVGVPTAIISGEIVADMIQKAYG